MGRNRSRSRSPRRDRRERDVERRDRDLERREPRDRDRDRERRRDRNQEPRRRSRSRSPRRRRSRSASPRRRSRSRDRDDRGDKPDSKSSKQMLVDRPQISEADLEGKSQDEIEMMKIMGFGGFQTTKGKHVPGNDVYVANITRKRRYRQYMNRRGGFNRPLDFIA